jgi:hypothetical protein
MICLWRHIHLRYRTLYRSVYRGVVRDQMKSKFRWVTCKLGSIRSGLGDSTAHTHTLHHHPSFINSVAFWDRQPQ